MIDQVAKRWRVAVLINDMNSACGIQRVAAHLARDLQPWYRTMLLSVEPLRAPVFYEPDLEICSLNVKRRSHTRIMLLRELLIAGRKLRSFVNEQQIDTVLAIWYDWASVAAIALPNSVKKVGCEHMSYWQATRTWQLIRSGSYRYLDAVVGLTAEDLPLYKKISRSASGRRCPSCPLRSIALAREASVGLCTPRQFCVAVETSVLSALVR